MRHSLAHIMASAVMKLWPEAKLGIGPVIENGFYYDIDLGEITVSEDDFEQIEDQMRQIIAEKQKFECYEKPIDEAIAWSKAAKQPYKEELLNDLKREGTTLASELEGSMMGLPAGIVGTTPAKLEIGTVTFYKNGDFVDLCRGPHLENTGEVKAFKLMRVAGAYWRGNEKNTQMQRLYGVAFNSEKELRQHLNMIEEAKKRDHRKLGQELDLFAFSDLVGAGLPLFTPRGTVIREQLLNFSSELQEKYGYEKVNIPHITKRELYEKSGHWDKFGDELFLVQSQETSDQFVLKPMNCPHHTQIYASRPRSYRDLPVRYMEATTQYRDEKKGELNGLSRVRSISIDDSHVFCRPDQIEEEMFGVLDMVKEMYSVLGMEFKARLSFRDDSEGYLGDKKLWENAQKTLEAVAKKHKLVYEIETGEAAFYGPKIDIMVVDALGREWQCATEQLDFVQPERFELSYVSEEGVDARPVMIHKALLGSVERFMSVYIEHTAGRFPIWLAPEQLRIITVNQEDSTTKFAEGVFSSAKKLGLRVNVDNDNESVGKKIRNAELMKVPYTVVIGEKEIKSGKLTPRIRSDMEVQPSSTSYEVDAFLKTLANEAKARVHKTSL